MRLIDTLLRRLGDWLGIEAEQTADPLTTTLRPYTQPLPVDPVLAARADAAFASLRADCWHSNSTSLDHLDDGDPEKVWRCADCGLDYRVVINPAKPWFVREIRPVAS